MRLAGVVKSMKYCWRKVKTNNTPITTKRLIVRLSPHAQVGPAKVRTMVKDTMVAVDKVNPTQSRDMNLARVDLSWSPPGLTFGR